MAATDTPHQIQAPGLYGGRRGRHFREALTAYLFIAPAFLIIGVFGLFPIVFAFYVSLHRWRINPGRYLGLDNYVRAVDSLAYVLTFWLAIIFVALAARKLLATVKNAREHDEQPWIWLLPAAVTTVGLAAFVRFGVTLLPEVLTSAKKPKVRSARRRSSSVCWETPGVSQRCNRPCGSLW